ncbi:MAG: biotin transporter BioY [Ignavibacteriaceae bacterium]|nr:biotin transporter BioY [Ignavibacteriaceae bacterium]
METIKNLTTNLKISNILSKPLTWVISFAVLTAIAAQISVPVKPVPFTLQTVAVVLAGAFLGAKKGFQSQLLYLGLGIIGLPVFALAAEPTIGFARLIGPTGGYLLAFPLAAYVVGLLVEKYKNYYAVVGAMLLGNLIILVTGTLYLDLVYLQSLTESLKLGALIFSVWTVVKVMISVALYFGIKSVKK